MPVQIFVEDELNEAYEILAYRALSLDLGRSNRRQLRVSRVEVQEIRSLEGLWDLVETSSETGFDCVLFLMDEESLASPDRDRNLKAFHRSFQQLCQRLDHLPPTHPLKNVKVTIIAIQTCLESWLASDPQGIIDAVQGGKRESYPISPRNTEQMSPSESLEYLVNLVRTVGRKLNRRDLLQTNSRNIKTMGKRFALSVRLSEACRHNRSLAYFAEMVKCEQSGCENPFRQEL